MNANELADELVSINDGIEYEYNRFKQIDQAATMLRQQQAEIDALKNQLEFIVNINRLGLGVQKEGGLSSDEIEKVWLSIEEQRDDNFHYGWKKCEQYYGLSNVDAINTSQECVDKTQNNRHELTDKEIKSEWYKVQFNYIEFARAVLRKVQEK